MKYKQQTGTDKLWYKKKKKEKKKKERKEKKKQIPAKVIQMHSLCQIS